MSVFIGDDKVMSVFTGDDKVMSVFIGDDKVARLKAEVTQTVLVRGGSAPGFNLTL